MGEIQSERFRKKNETEQEKRGHKEKGKLNKELSLNKDTKREVYFSLPFLSFIVN